MKKPTFKPLFSWSRLFSSTSSWISHDFMANKALQGAIGRINSAIDAELKRAIRSHDNATIDGLCLRYGCPPTPGALTFRQAAAVLQITDPHEEIIFGLKENGYLRTAGLFPNEQLVTRKSVESMAKALDSLTLKNRLAGDSEVSA